MGGGCVSLGEETRQVSVDLHSIMSSSSIIIIRSAHLHCSATSLQTESSSHCSPKTSCGTRTHGQTQTGINITMAPVFSDKARVRSGDGLLTCGLLLETSGSPGAHLPRKTRRQHSDTTTTTTQHNPGSPEKQHWYYNTTD